MRVAGKGDVRGQDVVCQHQAISSLAVASDNLIQLAAWQLTVASHMSGLVNPWNH